MPIYAYRCEECGFAKDVLQKMSDEPLTVCLECGKPSFKKQVTAAGFQLKGSGWYVTDFRDGKGGAAAGTNNKANAASAESGSGSGSGAESGASAGSGEAATSATAAVPAVSSAPAPVANVTSGADSSANKAA